MAEKYGLDKEIAEKLQKKYDNQMETDALKWIQEIIDEDFTSSLPSLPSSGPEIISSDTSDTDKDQSNDTPSAPNPKMSGFRLFAALKNGVILCKLLNHIKPGIIKKFNANPTHVLEERNNIQQYLVGCAILMIPESDLFSISDLHEAKNMTQVLQNIYALGRQCQVIEGFQGPRLGVKFSTSLQVQKERKQRRKLEEIFAQEKQIEKEEEALHRRKKLETRALSISEMKYQDEENRAHKRRLRRGDTFKADSHSIRHRRFEVDEVKFGIDAECKEAIDSKYDTRAEQVILDWIELLTGETLDYFYEGLKSGVVLCKLLNAIRPGLIKDISEKPIPLMERENIKKYLRAAQGGFALQSFELFTVSDLYEKKNLSAVLSNIQAIARKARSISSFPGPQLKDVEDGKVSIHALNIADKDIENPETVAETFKSPSKSAGGSKALQDMFTPPPSNQTPNTSTEQSKDEKDDEIARLEALLESKKSGGGKRKLEEMRMLMEALEAERKASKSQLEAEEEALREEEKKLEELHKATQRRRNAFAKTKVAAKDIFTSSTQDVAEIKSTKVESTSSRTDSTIDAKLLEKELEEEATRQIMAEIEAEKRASNPSITVTQPSQDQNISDNKSPSKEEQMETDHFGFDSPSLVARRDRSKRRSLSIPNFTLEDMVSRATEATNAELQGSDTQALNPSEDVDQNLDDEDDDDLSGGRSRSRSVSARLVHQKTPEKKLSPEEIEARDEAERKERFERRRRHREEIEERERAEEAARQEREEARRRRREQQEAEELAAEQAQKELQEKKRLAKLEREEQERLAEIEKSEQAEIERKKAEEAEMAEIERKKAEQAEIDRLAEIERKKADQAEIDRLAEIERKKAEEAEIERRKAEKAEIERKKAEEAEIERKKAEQAEIERKKAEEAEIERRKAEEAEIERKKAEQAEIERKKAEKAEIERKKAEQAEIERKKAEEAEIERRKAEEAEIERKKAEQAEIERKKAEKAEIERKKAEEAEIERKKAEQAEIDRLAEIERKKAEDAEIERKKTEQAEIERKKAEQAEIERKKAEQAEIERKNAEEAEIERKNAEEAEIERKKAEQVEIEPKKPVEAVQSSPARTQPKSPAPSSEPLGPMPTITKTENTSLLISEDKTPCCIIL